MTTATAPASILPALVKIVRPFAHKGQRGPVRLRDALVRHDGGSTRVCATDLELACNVIACEPTRPSESYLVDAASGVPVGSDISPLDFPAVDRLDGATVCEFSIDYRDFRRVADHVASATDPESARYALGGVLLEASGTGHATFIGTDGRRLHAARFAVADATGEVATNTLLPGRMFAAAAKAIKAAAVMAGVKGRRIDGEAVTIAITGKTARVTWAADTVAVEVFCRLVEGRFPRWRDAAPANPGTVCPVDAAATVAACGESIIRTKAAEAVAREAWDADHARRGIRPAARGRFDHPRGVKFSPAGLECRGCDYRASIPTAVEVFIDPAFVGPAVDAAAEFGAATVDLRIIDTQNAVTLHGGAWEAGGTGFFAIIMPLAID